MAPEMTNKLRSKPAVLCILDGWGDGPDSATNAITRAHTPNWDAMSADGFQAHLDASEHHVGLPDGQMGNSEVGHMNLGAGRIVLQDLPRIDAAIAEVPSPRSRSRPLPHARPIHVRVRAPTLTPPSTASLGVPSICLR